MQRSLAIASVFLLLGLTPSIHAIEILVDYTHDTNNFFDNQVKRDALEAAANRWAAVINSELLAVDASYMSGNQDWRVGFTHPGTGDSFQISTASGTGTDALYNGMNAADLYDPTFALPENTWILFAGGRALGSGAVGGTGTGSNTGTTFNDPFGPHRRGLGTNLGVSGLPVWGGAISFDTGTNWHYDVTVAPSFPQTDLYTVALHEIGHALGLSSGWTDFTDEQSGALFTGPNAVTAYNQDNGASLTALNLESATNRHWEDGTYESMIFAPGNPNYVGTVGEGNLQDLAMEPVANFVFPTKVRFELTNVDVGAARDIGWSIVPEPSTYALGVMGMLSLALLLWRRRHQLSS